MRIVSHLAAAVLLALVAVPAFAAAPKDSADCEQMTNPGLKVAACTRILQSGPANDAKVAAYHHRGVGLLLQTKFDQAIVEFNEALRIDPTYKRSYNSRGNAWKGKGELDLAIADYNEAIRLDPSFAFPYNGRANAWYNKGEWDRAIADYDEVIRLDPSLAAPYANRGMAWRGKGDFDRALADAERGATPRSEKCRGLRQPRRDLAAQGRPRPRADRSGPVGPARSQEPAAVPVARRHLSLQGRFQSRVRRLRPSAAADAGLHPGVGRARSDLRKARQLAARPRRIRKGDRIRRPSSAATMPAQHSRPRGRGSRRSTPARCSRSFRRRRRRRRRRLRSRRPDVAVPAAPAASTGKQGRRVALVIGNSGYQNVPAGSTIRSTMPRPSRPRCARSASTA